MADELPKEVSRGKVRIGPMEVEVIQLDDGRRLITVESMAALLNWMGHDAGPIGKGKHNQDGDA